jgi:hypothetical protein
MSKPLANRIPFAKIVIGLVIVFILSLGLCGVSLVVALQPGMPHRWARLVNQAAGLDMVVLVLSAFGLVATVIAWVVLAIVGSSVPKVSQPQNFSGEHDGTNLDKKD